MLEIAFLGATGTVTGSKYLLTIGSKKILVDCGLFQGFKQLRLRNWAPLPVDPTKIDAVILTHAHLDHSGYLPLLVKEGFAGKVYCHFDSPPKKTFITRGEPAAADALGHRIEEKLGWHCSVPEYLERVSL
ncbi:MAG TPA: MBL fold metallo-hydrolase [Candidatus Brocadiales bacterium]|nr:MBL fold metallo-hydrolase [Candidatus Brocadiales bacterium]